MAGGQATLRTPTACKPLVLLLLVLLSLDGYGGGVKAAAGGVAATEAGRGLSTSTPTAEARLRAAMTNPNTTIVRLTSDIRLTSDLPYVTCPNLTVIGNCTTDSGQPRLCQIDGGQRFGGFAGSEELIILTLQNLLMSHFTLSKEDVSSVIAVGGTIVVKNCLFQNNTGDHRGGLFGAFTGTVTIENSTFIGNNRTVIGGMFGNVYLKEVVFRSNIGGPVISLYRATVDGERCEFVANAGGAVSVFIGSLSFTNSSFVNNSGGAVSAEDASATLCYCQFEGNYMISEDGGKREVEHVYYSWVTYEARLLFCKQRPQVGVHVGSPNGSDLDFSVKDSCEQCPK